MLTLTGAKIRLLGLPDGFTVTCHAGALGTQPNSLESVKKCVEAGAAVVEFDVSFRSDGKPVIIHSSSPKADEGADFEQALQLVAKSKTCKINLDLKAYSNLSELDRLVEKHGLMGRVFFTGVEENQCETVKEFSSIPYFLNCSFVPKKRTDDVQRLAEKITALGAAGLNTHYSNVNSRVVEFMHKNALPVSAWTADRVFTMKKLVRLKVDNITTRKPDKLVMLYK